MQQLRFGQDSGKITDVTGPTFGVTSPIADLGTGTAILKVGVLIGLAYSGNGEGLNNSSMDTVHDKGVIRRGKYKGALVSKPELGPRVFELTPDSSNDMQGRGGFLIHWDTPAQNFGASDGCIVPLNTASVMARINNEFELEVSPR